MIRAQMPQGLKDYLEKILCFLISASRAILPVLVFKSKSYAYVFSEMLKWEKSLADDLKALFPRPTCSATILLPTNISKTTTLELRKRMARLIWFILL